MNEEMTIHFCVDCAHCKPEDEGYECQIRTTVDYDLVTGKNKSTKDCYEVRGGSAECPGFEPKEGAA